MPRFQISEFPQMENDVLHVPKGKIQIYIYITYYYLFSNGVLLSCSCICNIGLELRKCDISFFGTYFLCDWT